jgi:ABC-type transport system involved in cytochrome c biogenesis permease subunit
MRLLAAGSSGGQGLMPLFWLRIAVVLYACGLLYVIALVSKRGERLTRFIVPAVSMGMVFHFVSLVEAIRVEHLTLASIHHAESLLAFVLMFLFMVVRVKYKTTAPGIFVFPLVFFLTFASSIARTPLRLEAISPALRSGWIFGHVALIFTGYAALFLSFVASLLYIVQSRALKAKLKSKQADLSSSKLPPLEVIDDIGYKSLLLGFPFMTLGLVMGAVIAQAKLGPTYFTDPKVALSLVMWLVYMILLYMRWNSGWRGKRAAYLATVAFVMALVAWGANFISRIHNPERLLRP